MNRAAQLQDIADEILINKILILDAGLRKDAGLREVVSGATEAVANFVRENIDMSSTASAIRSLFIVMAPAILFRINPVLGTIAATAGEFNINMHDIWNRVMNAIKPAIESGKGISGDDIRSAGESLLSTGSSKDFFEEIRKYADEGSLLKFAQGFFGGSHSKTQPLGGSALFPPKGSSFLHRVLGNLAQPRRHSIIVGFVVYFIKNILVSLGLVAGAGAVGGLLSSLRKKDETEAGLAKSQEQQVPTTREQVIISNPRTNQEATVQRAQNMQLPPPAAHTLQPSGQGEYPHPNNDKQAWVIPVYGSMQNTLALWTYQIYPETANYKDVVTSSPALNRMANVLGAYIDSRSPNWLVMPAGIATRKQVVDSFVADIERKIRQKQNNEQKVQQ